MSSAVSPTKAAEIADVSRQTIYNDMDSGDLSFNRQGKRKRTIDISELERQYGTLKIPSSNKTTNEPSEDKLEVSNDVKKGDSNFTNVQKRGGDTPTELVELAVAREKIKNLETLVENLQDEKEYLRKALEKAQNNETHLIEDKRSESEKVADWEKNVADMQKKIAAFELKEEQAAQAEKTADREKNSLKTKLEQTEKALNAEKSKTAWQKLTGK